MRIAAVWLLPCLLAGLGQQELAQGAVMVSTLAMAPVPVSDNGAAAARSAGQDRLTQISRFDCVPSSDVTDDAEFPWSKGVSHWSGGGPSGATWNAGELHCAVEFQTRCAQGNADIELRVGGALSGSERPTISRAGAQQISFRLLARKWEKHFDQVSPPTKRVPYRTATFSASVTVSCKAPEVAGPSMGPRLEFADDHHFTAGFAEGE
jgi:hypothetical protein